MRSGIIDITKVMPAFVAVVVAFFAVGDTFVTVVGISRKSA